MTVYEAHNVFALAVQHAQGDKELTFCLQTLGEHRHLKVAGIKLRNKGQVQHAGENEVILEIV